MARYSNPQTNAGRDSYHGHFEMSDSPKDPAGSPMDKYEQPHAAPDNLRHLAVGDHTHMGAVIAVKPNAMQTYAAPARKPGTQATLQPQSSPKNTKAVSNEDDRTITTGEAVKRSVKVMGKSPMKNP